MPADLGIQEGDLQSSLAQLQQRVRSDPSSVKNRIFLFQLLTVMGDWNRAMTQLSVVEEMDIAAMAMVKMYREAVKCEVFRAEVFAGQKSPLIFGEPEKWLAMQIEALRLTAEGQHAKSQELRGMAFDQAPTTSGRIDDTPFEWIADADSRMGPVLEAIVNGRYYWIPFHRISRIQIEKPEDLRDIVWMPAHFKWDNGGEAVGLIPTRYAGSEASEDGLIRMARRTEWIECEGEMYLGRGQRTLTTDAGEYALMDVRNVELETSIKPKGTA